MRIKQWTPITVEWNDAWITKEAANSQDEFPPARRISCGFFLRRTKSSITICGEDDRGVGDSENDCENVTTIPLSMGCKITLWTPVEVINTRKKKEKPVEDNVPGSPLLGPGHLGEN